MRSLKFSLGLLALAVLSLFFNTSYLAAYNSDDAFGGGAIAPQFRFVISEMTAYAGETVNICVERDYSLLSAETTLKVYTFNEEGIMAQSLLFAGGVREVCFDFTVPEQPFEEGYYFTIGGDGEPLKLYVLEGIQLLAIVAHQNGTLFQL